MYRNLEVMHTQEVLGHGFKMYGTFDEPLFLAKDVAEWIEHTDLSRMVELVDEDEKLKRTLYVSGQNREMWFLTEDGLYEVLMQSRKPIAKMFKKEVKKILKNLRKGSVKLPSNYKEALIALVEAEEIKEQLELEVKIKDQVIGELKPKADYTDEILKSNLTLNISQIAKDYGISGVKLNEILNELKVQYKQNKQWLLYSNYQNKGFTKSTTTDKYIQTKWTQKGRLFLYELLKENGILPIMEKEVD